MASKRNGVLYVGVTSNLVKRVWKTNLIDEVNPEWDDLYERIAGGFLKARFQPPLE